MADDVTTTTPAPESAAPPAAPDPVERSSAFLERAIERFGGPEATADIPEQPSAPSTETSAGDVRAEAERLRLAHQGAAERHRRARQEREREAEHRALLGLYQELQDVKERLPQPAPADDGPKPPDPALFDNDPQEWYRQQNEYLYARMERAIDQRVQPLIESQRRAHETQQQYERRIAAESQEQDGRRYHHSVVTQDEALYAATPEAHAAYSQRVGWLQESLAQEFMTFGQAPEEAAFEAQRAIRGVVENAAANGRNTAAVVDEWAQRRLQAAFGFARAAGFQLSPAEAQAARTTSLQSTAASVAAGGAAAPLATSGRPARTAPIGERAKTMSTAELRAEIAKHGPNAQAKIKELLASANAARRKAG